MGFEFEIHYKEEASNKLFMLYQGNMVVVLLTLIIYSSMSGLLEAIKAS